MKTFYLIAQDQGGRRFYHTGGSFTPYVAWAFMYRDRHFAQLAADVEYHRRPRDLKILEFWVDSADGRAKIVV
jgi:hypothetical protein